MKIKSYREVITLTSFLERFTYLKLGGTVGKVSFGFERYLNQTLYSSKEWKRVRDDIIIRDNACDLAVTDRDIFSCITIHHINPISIEDIEARAPAIFDLDNLICTSPETHRAIHYGDITKILSLPDVRKRGDTCPWKVY